jgi:MinD-like ATPase involved in chromosome partitioning or flagellar assembly
VHLVVNRVAQRGLGKVTFERLAEVSRRFAACEIHYLGEVPEDPAVTHRRLGQPPLLCSSPECATTKAVLAMLDVLAERVALPPARVHAGGVQARMLAQIRRW